MSARRSRLLAPVLAVVLASSAAGCFRYVTRADPHAVVHCPPEPPTHAFAQYRDDPRVGRGILRGHVFDAQTIDSTRPLAGAAVSIEGATLGAVTDDSGRFAIAGVTPGPHAVLTRRVGYHVRRDSVVVSATGTTFDVGLTMSPMDGCPGFGVVVERKRVWRWPWQ